MRRVGTVFVALLWATTARAAPQTPYPLISSTEPVAVSAGTETSVTILGQHSFAGAYRVQFSGDGVSAELESFERQADSTSADDKFAAPSHRMTVRVDSDAQPGVRDFRVITPRGISSIGQLVVVDGPVVREAADNDESAKAQLLTLPAHVSGRIEKAEKIDFYGFHANADVVVTCSVICQRLQDRIHDLFQGGGSLEPGRADPILVLRDQQGRELAAADNDFAGDPVLSYRVEQAGEYLLEVRDVRYSGDMRWGYVLSITSDPYLLGVFPPVAAAGEHVQLEPIGYNADRMAPISWTVPLHWQPGMHQVRLDGPAGKTDPVSLLVTELAWHLAGGDNCTMETAEPIARGTGITGRLAAPNDVHLFVFDAKAEEAFSFEITARPLGSALDCCLDLLDASGHELAANDDADDPVLQRMNVAAVLSRAVTRDSRLTWTAPADGKYWLRVRDLHGRGGTSYFYFLAVRPVQPDFTLQCDDDKAMLAPGTHRTWYVKAQRRNGLTGAIALRVRGLPRGITATCATIPPCMTQGAVILSADWDAPRDARTVEVVGTACVTMADGSERELEQVAQPLQEIYLPGAYRGLYGVQLHTVAVTEPADLLLLEPSRRELHLRPGQSARIDINLKRNACYTKHVTLDAGLRHLDLVYGDPLPPGISVDEKSSKLRLEAGETRGHIVLKAAENATSVCDLPISIQGSVFVNLVVEMRHSTPPILLTVGPQEKPADATSFPRSGSSASAFGL